MKSSRTLALGLVALAVFSDLGEAQQKGEENTPAAGASSSNSPLTPEVLGKMLDLIVRKGFDREVPAPIASALGLSSTGHTWPSRQVASHESRPDYLHGFAIHRKGEQGLAISLRTPSGIHAYRTERNGKLV